MSTFRDWMYDRKDERGSLRDEFATGVRIFLDFAFGPKGTISGGKITCPCARCKCRSYHDYGTVHMHLIRSGFMENYHLWHYHGETETDYGHEYREIAESSTVGGGGDVSGDDDEYNPHVDMVQDMFPHVNIDGQRDDVGEEPNPRAKLFYEMYTKAQQPLYPGANITLLDWASTIMSNKTSNRDSQVSANCTVKIACRSVLSAYQKKVPQDW